MTTFAHAKVICSGNTIENIASRSLSNCHVPGLHSLVLDATPGTMVRMFYAAGDHSLWLNEVRDGKFVHDMSLAMHGHHCDLDLVPIVGHFQNITTRIAQDLHQSDILLDSFKWTSYINTGKGNFEPTGTERLLKPVSNIYEDRRACMRADDLHTVFVERNTEAAWLVFEGREDPDYNALSYSNVDLGKFTTDGLYHKMTAKTTENILKFCGLI